MRGTAVGFAVGAVLACGGGTTSPNGSGTLFFRIDQVTCTGTHSTYFQIDATEVGPETLGPGATSNGYVVSAKTHTARARIMNYFGTQAALWTANLSVKVPANTSVFVVVVC